MLAPVIGTVSIAERVIPPMSAEPAAQLSMFVLTCRCQTGQRREKERACLRVSGARGAPKGMRLIREGPQARRLYNTCSQAF